MRYLLLISCLIIQLGCVSAYKNLQHTTGDPGNVQRFKPVITTALYKIDVNVVGKYLSGLLLLKTMPDSSIRMVFSNEMGFKFFDFEFASGGGCFVGLATEQSLYEVFGVEFPQVFRALT